MLGHVIFLVIIITIAITLIIIIIFIFTSFFLHRIICRCGLLFKGKETGSESCFG